MKQHVAILKREYVEMVLAGKKTIESRLTRNRGPAFETVCEGDVIHIKQLSGAFRARAIVSGVLHRMLASPNEVERIRREFGNRIGGTDDYWLGKLAARYCTLVWLADVEPISEGPRYRSWRGFGPRAGWIVGPPLRVTTR